jgi:Mn2+/Fe2+ NRAMP family transporter
LFEKVMRVCIAVMFVVVVVAAARVTGSWIEVGVGLVWPRIPRLDGQGLEWTVALMGGVGGTVTVLCYGYWIREAGRHGADALRVCRIDLAAGYTMTALFGISMIIIGSTVEVKGGGATLLVDLADQLAHAMGPGFKWLFLIGAWGAVFSSLLGVWQSVPYLFADFWQLLGNADTEIHRSVDTRGRPYQAYLFALAVIPAVGLWLPFAKAQKWYAVFGALFIPMLALVLLALNGRSRLVGRQYRNSRITAALLIACLALFILFLWFKVRSMLAA